MILNLFYFLNFISFFLYLIFYSYTSREPFYSAFSHKIKKDQRKPYYIYYFITCITFEFITFITRYATFFWTEISKIQLPRDGKWLKLFTSYFLLERTVAANSVVFLTKQFSLSILFLALLMGSRTWSKSSSMPRWHNDGHILFWLMIFRPSDERKSVALSRMPETAVVIAIIDDLNLSRSARKSLGRAEHQIRECLPLRDRRH